MSSGSGERCSPTLRPTNCVASTSSGRGGLELNGRRKLLGQLKKVNHQEVLQRLRDERTALTRQIEAEAGSAAELAFAAECGDEDAKTTRARLLEQCAAGRTRLAELNEAIASGERAAEVAAHREAERKRAQHERKALAARRKLARSSTDIIRTLRTLEQHFADLTAARVELHSEATAAGRDDLVRMSDIATRGYALTGGLHKHAPLLARALSVPHPARKSVTVLDSLAKEEGVTEDA